MRQRILFAALAAVGALSVGMIAAIPAANAATCDAGYASGACVVSISPSSTTVATASSAGGTATVSVPPGALPPGTTLNVAPVAVDTSVATQVASSSVLLGAFSVTWATTNGSTPNASTAISMVVTGLSAPAGTEIYAEINGKLVDLGQVSASGSVTVSFTADPTIVLLEPAIMKAASTKASINATSIGVSLDCTQGAKCAGIARLNVAREVSKGKYKQITVATAKYSIKTYAKATVFFNYATGGEQIVAAGRKLFPTNYRLGLVLLPTGGIRTVGAITIN